MTEHRHYSGPDLALLLRQVRDELGSNAEILRAERIRSGGLAGFFAREHYEVVAKRPAVSSPASSVATPTAGVGRNADDELIADEPIGKPAPAIVPAQLATGASTAAPSMRASTSDRPDPTTAEPGLVAGGTRRSIQAALLDRADRVSTEELLVRIADTHSPEWDSESFQSILGRAMVDAVGPSVDSSPATERRREQPRTDVGPDRRHETIDGLRLTSIGPGENVVDPVPPAPPVEPPAAVGEAVDPEGEPDPDRSMTSPESEDWWQQSHGPGAPHWANGVPPPWGPPWMQGWTPWTMNGWPAHAPAVPTLGPAPQRLCASCADALPADDHDDRPTSAPPEDETTDKPDEAPPWSQLRREIDDVRLQLDEIIEIIGHAMMDGDLGDDTQNVEAGFDGGEEPPSGRRNAKAGADAGPVSGDRRRPVSARSEPDPGRDRSGRGPKNSRRSGRTGR